MTYKDMMIQVIREHQYYKAGELEQMDEAEVKEIYEALLDWIG